LRIPSCNSGSKWSLDRCHRSCNTGKEIKGKKRILFDIANVDFTTIGVECVKCSNNSEILRVYKDNELIDSWGNKCEKGAIRKAQ